MGTRLELTAKSSNIKDKGTHSLSTRKKPQGRIGRRYLEHILRHLPGAAVPTGSKVRYDSGTYAFKSLRYDDNSFVNAYQHVHAKDEKWMVDC
ncbi:hypothetical protein EVAR_83349_1 [Eumeta japonica]|uniref:Uncharacterized protein n=1 Tax=Eumeta variegata TaxID=151549 RepID=A0A4C1VW96_EUMVA|nr:hypothetical protein EVAR_83349_1 [Eumeta japonica]